MKQIFIFLAVFVSVVNPVRASDVAPVIQRYAVVGTSVSGDKIAIMLTHFGPSSNAPFATLNVYEAGSAVPLFSNAGMLMSGSEKELAMLATEVLNKSRNKLIELGVDIDAPVYGDANYALIPASAGAESTGGQIDIEAIGLKSFSIKSSRSRLCPDIPNAGIEISLENSRQWIEPENSADCSPAPPQLRTIIRTQNAVWFVILKPQDALGTPFYLVHIAGLKLEPSARMAIAKDFSPLQIRNTNLSPHK